MVQNIQRVQMLLWAKTPCFDTHGYDTRAVVTLLGDIVDTFSVLVSDRKPLTIMVSMEATRCMATLLCALSWSSDYPRSRRLVHVSSVFWFSLYFCFYSTSDLPQSSTHVP
jgi:hypothetical protein